MEEGCNLPCDEKDQQQIEESIEKGRSYQIDPELRQQYQLSQIHKITVTHQPGEKGFNKVQYDLEKGAEKIRKITDSYSELSRDDDKKMEEAGARYIGNSENRKHSYTLSETGEIRIGTHREDGAPKTPPEFCSDYVWERVHGYNRHKINAFQKDLDNRKKAGKISLEGYIQEYCENKFKYEARAAIRKTEISLDLKNKLDAGIIKEKDKPVVSELLKHLIDEQIAITLKEEKDRASREEIISVYLRTEGKVAGENQRAEEFYAKQAVYRYFEI